MEQNDRRRPHRPPLVQPRVALACNAYAAPGCTALTPKAHAALLLLIGEYSSAENDISDPGNAEPITNIRSGRNGPLADGIFGRMPCSPCGSSSAATRRAILRSS